MPILGGLLVGLFTALAEFFVAFMAKDVAMRLAFGALAVAGFATLYAVTWGLMSGISLSMPTILSDALVFVFPSNLASCVAAALGTDAACVAYRLYVVGLGR